MGMHFTVVPHVHWDREWYFTQQKSQVYLNRYLSDVMDELDANPRIPSYLLDAQTSIVDDYLADHPERESQLRRLISTRRLLSGPWYSQCDQLVVHGESIVRNLVYGTRRAKDLGHCLNIGYAPDCFGQAAQLPQILRGFGIPYVMFKRGIDANAIPSDDFIWRSDDGSAVFAYHLLDYMNFRKPSSTDAEANVRLVKGIERDYEPRSLSKEAFLFNGFDQFPLRKDIDGVVDAMGMDNVSFGDLEDVFAKMATTPNLPVFEGELTSGMTTRVHKSIFSSRADIKALNAKAENELVRIAEPLQAIYHALTGREERNLLKRVWKQLMECSAHDSIGCCNSDQVNRDIYNRLEEALSSAREYEKIVCRQIAEGSAAEPFSFQAYNLLPYEREQEVSMTLLAPGTSFEIEDGAGRRYPVDVVSVREATGDVAHAFARRGDAANNSNPYLDMTTYACTVRCTLRLPAMGYETFRVVEPSGNAATTATEHGGVLENAFLRVGANPDGTLEVVDKVSGHAYHNVLELVDDVDAGDSYDWSSDPAAPLVVSSKDGVAKVSSSDQTMTIGLQMVLPANRDERIAQTCSVAEKVELTVTLPSDRPTLLVTARVANAAVDHRLRVLVPTDIASEWSHADQTFGLIDRPTRLAAAESWRELGWDERPRTIEPMQSLCYLEGDGRLVQVISDSVKEYQVVGEDMDILAYTLFRSFTMMGRADLPDRPGRESGKAWPTPDAALLKELEFTFAVGFPQGVSEAVRLASEYTTPIRVHQKAIFDIDPDEFLFGGYSPAVPQTYCALSVEGDVQPSIYKLSEDEGGGTILRVTALSDGPITVRAKGSVCSTNLAETEDEPLVPDALYKRNQIVTFKIGEG